MFCKRCGSQMSDTASFCNKCGNQIVVTGPINEQNVPPMTPMSAQQIATGAPIRPITLQASSHRPIDYRVVRVASAFVSIVIVVGIVFAVIAYNNANNSKMLMAMLDKQAEMQTAEREAEETAKIEAERRAQEMQIEADRVEIQNALDSFAYAMTEWNYKYAAEFCVPGSMLRNGLIEGADSFSIAGFSFGNGGLLGAGIQAIGGAASFLGMEDYIITMDKDFILFEGDKAEFGMIINSATQDSYNTVTVRKLDGVWKIESIKKE